MAELIVATDWSVTPLGPIETWPQSLRTTVSLCLASNFPINIIWGPEHNQIYNDGYRVVCGEAHPKALGEPYTKTWASAWPAIGQPFETARAGQTSFLENQRMFLFRNGYLEETFFTFSLSPIRDESGGIGGLFHPVTETTASMLAERRARLLRDLNANLGEARTVREVFVRAVETIAGDAFDLPFMLLYELAPTGDAYRLAGQIGLEPGSPGAPLALPVNALSPWPVQALAETREAILIDGLDARLGGAPCGPYEEAPSIAFAHPIIVAGSSLPVALLIAGASPRLPLDEAYRGFFTLLTAAVAAGLANARTYEDERRKAEMLAALDQAKTAFFSNVSHEFRTPLTLMLGPIEDALDDAASLSATQRERLDVAHRNALRLLKLVNSLLDFSRIEAGRTQASFEPTDLSALTAELASNFRSACERAGLGLIVDCQPLPGPVHVDRDMWEKVVLNLISNAFKFTLEGQITVTLRAIDGAAELTVADTGLGIAEDELPRVFERFHRIEGQKGRTHEGTGIGLSLVDELVKLHGGAVSVRSRLGEGATFSATIPLGVAHLPREHLTSERTLSPTTVRAEAYVAEALRWLPQSARPETEGEGPAASIEGRPRVVLADDNADMRGYVQRLLEDGGYEVEAVENGRAALQVIQRGPVPELVLSDVMMPELDGFGLLAALRANPDLEGLLIILLSARAGEEARVEGLAAGADDYLVKPFSARELRARVDGAVHLARQRRQAASREQELQTQIVAERGKAALRQSEQQLEFALQAGRMGAWELDITTRRVTASDYCRTIFGLKPDDDFSHEEIVRRIHPEDRLRRHEAFNRAIAEGGELEIEYRTVRANGEYGWILVRGGVVPGEDRLAGVCLDITDRKTAEAHQRLLLDELNHRVKNTLASVQSIAIQTLRHAEHPSAFNTSFIDRIHALGRAHELLTEASWTSASLFDVVARTLSLHIAPGDEARIALNGPSVRLGPNAAVTLNMVFHELATNATKYGALSTSDGRVDVEWTVEKGGDAIVIEWRESNGPTVKVPARRGFGSRLIEQALTREMEGHAELIFHPEGLWCRIRLLFSAKLSLAA
jgi:PAS domain S-box-containing protein